MDSRSWRGFAALLIFLGRLAPAVGISGEEAACSRVSSVDSILSPLRDSCLVAESSADGFEPVGVVEVRLKNCKVPFFLLL